MTTFIDKTGKIIINTNLFLNHKLHIWQTHESIEFQISDKTWHSGKLHIELLSLIPNVRLLSQLLRNLKIWRPYASQFLWNNFYFYFFSRTAHWNISPFQIQILSLGANKWHSYATRSLRLQVTLLLFIYDWGSFIHSSFIPHFKLLAWLLKNFKIEVLH